MTATLPTFDSVRAERRWTGPLKGLFTALRRDAYTAGGGWAWRILPHGALVAMRIRPDFRKELRIARADAPASAGAMVKWEKELEVFLEHLGCVGWYRVPENEPLMDAPEPPSGGVQALYVQLYTGEYAPGLARCVDCGASISSRATPASPRCEKCLARHRGRALQTDPHEQRRDLFD